MTYALVLERIVISSLKIPSLVKYSNVLRVGTSRF